MHPKLSILFLVTLLSTLIQESSSLHKFTRLKSFKQNVDQPQNIEPLTLNVKSNVQPENKINEVDKDIPLEKLLNNLLPDSRESQNLKPIPEKPKFTSVGEVKKGEVKIEAPKQDATNPVNASPKSDLEQLIISNQNSALKEHDEKAIKQTELSVVYDSHGSLEDLRHIKPDEFKYGSFKKPRVQSGQIHANEVVDDLSKFISPQPEEKIDNNSNSSHDKIQSPPKDYTSGDGSTLTEDEDDTYIIGMISLFFITVALYMTYNTFKHCRRYEKEDLGEDDERKQLTDDF